MKKYTSTLSLCIISLVFAAALCACGGIAEPAKSPEATKQATPEASAPLAVESAAPEPEPVGVITGKVTYKGIEINRILEEPLENTLGEPLSANGLYYFYDGLEIYYNETVEMLFAVDLSLLEIDGATMDKTQAELIAMLGEPIGEYYPVGGAQTVEYRTSNGYVLSFSFGSGSSAHIVSIWSELAGKPTLEDMEQIFSIADAYEQFNRMYEYYGITYRPEMDREEDGARIYNFIVDYSYGENSGSDVYTYCYAWVNSLTGALTFQEAGESLYSNSPDTMLPLPMRNGALVPYDRFTPPEYICGISYSFLDISIMKTYQAQLREAGFTDHGTVMAIESYWTYERESDGKILCVELRTGGEGFSISMHAY